MEIRHHSSVLLVLTACFAVAPAMTHGMPLSEGRIDAIGAKAMAAFDVPGLAIAVIQPGGSVHAKGQGVDTVGGATHTDADTLFGIGSISKAFTTTAIAMLVEEGRLRWGDPVIDHLPAFRMADPWVTREFTVRDLVTHRSGLAPYAGDLVMFTDSKANKANVYRALAHLRPVTSFRTEFAYDNLLYVVAGDLVEKVSGQSWQEFIESRILRPLGMKGCVASRSRMPESARHASGHEYEAGKLGVVNFPFPDLVDAAGGIHCNASGMARWLGFNLNHGVSSDGARLLAEKNLSELFRPVVPVPSGKLATEYGQSNFAAYALGWFVHDSYGRLQAEHSGGLAGMVAHISVFPAAGVGVMVMTNRSSMAARAIILQIVEELFSSAPRDAISALAEIEHASAQVANVDSARFIVNHRRGAKPSLPLPAYAGTYTDSWFGDVAVRFEGGKLVMDLGSRDLTGTLEYFERDTFIARWANRKLNADAFVNFQLAATGNIQGIKMSAVAANTDASFDFHDLDLRKRAAGELRGSD